MIGYKIFTHDLRAPIQGGESIWDGSLPVVLPQVALDRSTDACGAGWNFVADVKTGLLIAGLWPDGRPSRVFKVQSVGEVIVRENKLRAGSLEILGEITEEEINLAIHDISTEFGACADKMAESQIAWRRALARPENNADQVARDLRIALDYRGLTDWSLKQYSTAWAARAAWTAWDAWTARAARDACNAWTAWAARDACDAWAAWAVRDAWATWDVRATWDAARAARDTWAARAARDALTVEYAAYNRWVEYPTDLLSRGLREAFAHGLKIAIPTRGKTLGWSIVENSNRLGRRAHNG